MILRCRPIAFVVAIVALSLIAAACGSSGHPASSGRSGARSSPLKIGMIADEGTAVDLSWAVAAAKGAVRRVNAEGGIAGHPVQLDFCNEALDPNKARACARQMVDAKVLAMAGSQPLAAEQVVDATLRNASIANVGTSSYGPSDTDPNSYLLFGGQTYVNAAQIALGTRVGGKRMALSVLDSPLTSAFVPFYRKALPVLGGQLVATVSSPQLTTDLSPQSAALVHSRPDWVNTNSAPAAVISVLKGMDDLGYTGKLAVSGTELTLAQIQSLGTAADQLLFVSPFPPVSAAARYPGLQQFVHDMATEAASGDKAAPTSHDYVQFLALDAYFSVLAIAKIANQAKAGDAAAFKKAINAAQNIDVGGVIPPWTPNHSISKAVPRASDGSFYFSGWRDGHAQLLSEKPMDVTAIVNAGAGG